MPDTIVFYLLSTLILAASLCVVFSRQPIYSVLSLLAAMFCLAAMFVTLGAYFVAALQILLYAGAVLVLFLFVIMLLNLEPDPLHQQRTVLLRALGVLVGGIFCAQFIGLIRAGLPEPVVAIAGDVPQGTVREIGMLLFTKFLVPFELTSFLILAAIVGAITLAQSKNK